MSTSSTTASTMNRRHRAVETCLERVRAVEERYGVGREMIGTLKPLLTDLALQTALFPLESFPVSAGKRGWLLVDCFCTW